MVKIIKSVHVMILFLILFHVVSDVILKKGEFRCFEDADCHKILFCSPPSKPRCLNKRYCLCN
uniref:Nodule-specific cysteine-rich peptide L60 n=1 Tax=Lens culinaris TaxID=3864 RepID=A0A7T8IGF6_LENCU|nr:nodule-specific cysteine-rich peptide L60 [Lens culinaris]